MPKEKRSCDSSVLCLNTNVSVIIGLKWEMDRAIRELLLNCVDQDLNAKVEEQDGVWVLENKGKLKKKHFTYATNKETVENRIKCGNYGYGLKDSIAILTALGVTYEAQSNGTSFLAFKDQRDLVCIQISKDTKKSCKESPSEPTVRQILKFNQAHIIRTAVESAKKQVLQFRPDILGCENIEIKGLGRVYLTKPGSTELFVQNCAYDFTDEDRRKPLAFAYNLYIDKKHLRGRDRVGLPTNWTPSLTKLIKKSPEKFLNHLSKLQERESITYYEFGHSLVLKYIREHRTQHWLDNKNLVEKHKNAIANIQTLRERLRVERESLADRDLPKVVRKTRNRNVATLEQELKDHEQIVACLRAPEILKPLVLVFRHEQSPLRDDVDFVPIAKVSEPLWKAGEIPTLEEYDLMQRSSIPFANLKKVRELHRLLYLMGTRPWNMTCVDAGAPPITVRNRMLAVDFTLPEEKLVVEAIHTLCSPLYFKPAQGLSHVQALSQFAYSLLQFAPESPQVLRDIENKDFSFDLPESDVAVVEKPFCPLLVDTAWNTKAGGISAFNIQLAEGLARAGCTVYVAVTDSVKEATTPETQASWDEAKAKNVIIVTLSQTRGNFTPELNAGQAAQITHIIGHAHITGKAAAQMHELPQLAHTRLWQFNHVLPREADQLKDYGSAESRAKKGRDKLDAITELNAAANVVWSVGQMMFDYFDHDFRRGNNGIHKQIILPLNPRFVQNHLSTKFGDTVNVLFFGRTEDVYYLKGMDIAQRACEYANSHHTMKNMKRRVCLRVRGLAPNTEVNSLLKLLAKQGPEHRDFQPFLDVYASQTEILAELKAADIFIMTSRVEPFGLAATEAIAAGVPVLVSDNSGVARLLEKGDFSDLCVKTSQYHPDLKQDDIKADTEAWGDAIVNLVARGESTFARARMLKEYLLKNIQPPYDDFIAMGRAN